MSRGAMERIAWCAARGGRNSAIIPAQHLFDTHPAGGHQPVETEEETMATDYDAPRKNEDDVSVDSLEELKNQRSAVGSNVVDEDENEAAEDFELPGADLSNEELTVQVIPRQADEFTCSQCFLVQHRSQLAYEEDGMPVCAECAE